MDLRNPSFNRTEHMRSYNFPLATASYLKSSPYSYYNGHVGYQEPYIHNGTVSLHSERPELVQVPSYPNTTYSPNMTYSRYDDLLDYRDYQQMSNHRPIPYERNVAQVPYERNVPSVPTSEVCSDIGQSRKYYDGPPYSLHIGRYETVPNVPSYPTNETALSSNYTFGTCNLSSAENDIVQAQTSNYSSIESIYPQSAVCKDDLAQETYLQDWQYDNIVNPLQQLSEMNRLIKPSYLGSYMMFPSRPATSLHNVSTDGFRRRPESGAAASTATENNHNPVFLVEQNRPEFQNWLVPNGMPFASRFLFSGTKMGSFMKIDPGLASDMSTKSLQAPLISSVFSVEEQYSISTTAHNNVKAGWHQSESSETLIKQDAYGIGYPPDAGESIQPECASDTNKTAIEILHEKLIDKLYAASPLCVRVTANDGTGCSAGENKMQASEEMSEVKTFKSRRFRSKRLNDLRRLCWERRLKITGTKRLLVNRLLDTTPASSASNQTRMKTIRLHLKRIGAVAIRGRCLCAAIDRGYLSMMDLSLSDVVAKGLCPLCGVYMEATLSVVVCQPDNSFELDDLSDRLKCPNCTTVLYVTKMCQGAPEFVQPEQHCHCMEKSMFGGCPPRITD